MHPGSVLVTNQVGIETVAGTPVAASRLLHALMFRIALDRATGQARARGSKHQTSSVGHKIFGKGSYEGLLCYNSIIYVLSGLFADPTPQQIGATAAYLRTYLASNASDITRKTLTFQSGNIDAVDRYPYGQLVDFRCNLSQSDASVSGDLFARQPAFNQSQTASPTKILARPVKRRHVDLFLDTAYGSLGATKVSEAMQETISIGEKWKAVWEHNTGTQTFRRAAELSPVITFGFVTPHNSQSRAYMDSLLDGQMRYLRLKCQGAQIALNGATPVYESIIFDFAGKVDAAEPEDEQDVFARRYSFHALHDDNLGGAFRGQVTNLLATL